MDERGVITGEDDATLVARCRRGRVDAFGILVERHQKRMLNVAYRMTGDYDEACEVVQEAFLSAYRAIRKFRGDAKFSTWLTGITINHAKNRMKRIRSRSVHEVFSLDDCTGAGPGSGAFDPPSREAPAVEQLERKEVRAKVWECIGLLDEEYREVLVLRDMEGFSYEEIRDILRVPDGTVKSRLYRARTAVKDCLRRVLDRL